MASGSGGGNLPEPCGGGGAAGTECESCRSAPGIPFCRVEWSFLCGGCAAVVHANNWIVAVPPNPNPNSNSNPCAYPYPYPYPTPNPDPSLVVQLSSDDDDRAGGGRRGRRRSAGKAAPPPLRVESVMRYREKRKSRKFEKTVRYENRKAFAEQRPRVDGKFARPAGSPAEGTSVAGDDAGMLDTHFQAIPSASEGVRLGVSEEVMPVGGEELGLLDAGEEVRLQ